MLEIKQEDKSLEFHIFFDNYGNLYLNNEQIGCFQINIDGKNQPCSIKYNYKIIEEYTNTGKIKDNKLLQDTLGDNLDYNLQNYAILIPKSSKYINLDNEKRYGYHNKEFNFANNPIISDLLKVYIVEDEEVASLYDTSIFDNNKRLLFQSSNKEEESIFNLILLLNGDLIINLVGNEEHIKYNIKIKNGDLEFIKN